MAYVSTREVISGFQGDFKLLCEKRIAIRSMHSQVRLPRCVCCLKLAVRS